MSKEFTCAHCGGTFDQGWSDEEAAAESRARFGTDRTQDPTMAVVCDDCYAMMVEAIAPEEWTGKQPRRH